MVAVSPTTLLAKRLEKGQPPLSLARHLRDTEDSAAAIFRPEGRWYRNWCRFFRLDEAVGRSFLLNLRVAALFHDIGKANADFYAAVTRGEPQSIRHEHLSALLLCIESVREWLARAPGVDVDIVTAAVLSHHTKASAEGRYAWGQSIRKPFVVLFLDHVEVRDTLARVADLCGLRSTPSLPVEHWSEAEGLWLETLKRGRAYARDFRRAERKDGRRNALTLAVKAALVVADAVASATAREGLTMADWVEGVVHSEAIAENEIRSKIIEPRAAQLSGRSGGTFTLRSFQREVAHQGRKVLLLAGCGSGKTIAAWNWANNQAAESDVGHVIFLYPTRGTATEGFRDYIAWAPEAEGTLVHGTASYELAGMRENPAESTEGKSFAPSDADRRLSALGLWSRRFFSATVDQFLGFLEHDHGSLCLLPLLADSVVIIDEVHSFDEHMFQNLLAFLGRFDLPVLCMTATLPAVRREQLVERGLSVFPSREQFVEYGDLEKDEMHPRYRISVLSRFEEAFREALDSHRNGKRVLWVTNTVARCQAISDRLEGELAEPVLSYHSRFKLVDRQAMHRSTIESFLPSARATIAVTTQVCEMSLDLDADVLITEVAPITALIQRLGRTNRHLSRGVDYRAPVYVCNSESVAPYELIEIKAAGRFVDALAGKDVSQRDLTEAMGLFSPPTTRCEDAARFCESGYYAVRGSFRDEENHQQLSVLDSDLEQVGQCRRRGERFDGFTLSIPRKFILSGCERPSWLPRYVGVAPGARYSPKRGFRTEGGAS